MNWNKWIRQTHRWAVHGLYGCRHRQHHRRGAGKYGSRLGGLAVFPLALLLFSGLYLFGAAVCRQVGAARDAPTERPAARRWPGGGAGLGGGRRRAGGSGEPTQARFGLSGDVHMSQT